MKEEIRVRDLIVYEGGRHYIGHYLAHRCAADALEFPARRFPAGR